MYWFQGIRFILIKLKITHTLFVTYYYTRRFFATSVPQVTFCPSFAPSVFSLLQVVFCPKCAPTVFAPSVPQVTLCPKCVKFT